jgi:hypothetical protein
MMTGTLWRRKEDETYGRGCPADVSHALRQWRLGLVPRAVERCLTPQVLEVRRRCPATRGCVPCGPGVIPD